MQREAATVSQGKETATVATLRQQVAVRRAEKFRQETSRGQLSCSVLFWVLFCDSGLWRPLNANLAEHGYMTGLTRCFLHAVCVLEALR